MSIKIPPGPWDAKGNRVICNGQTVAVVFYPRNASDIAQEIANLPDLLEEVAELRERAEESERGMCDELGE